MVLGNGLRSVLRDGGVVLVFFLLAGSVVWSVAALTGYGVAAAIIVTLVVIGLLVARLRQTADDDGSVWNAIPSRQYGGRHAESGGLARGEQEQALEAINDEAAQRTDNHRRRN